MLSYFGAQGGGKNEGLLPVAGAIAGHHAGMLDEWELTGARLNEQRYRDEMRAIVDRARNESPQLRSAIELLVTPSAPVNKSRRDLYTRMLFSCLVDADRLNSAGRENLQKSLDACGKLEVLLCHLRDLGNKPPDGIVKQMRARVLAECLDAADSPANLFSLSVPTGGGKTLASMAFALKRAAHFSEERFRRVIVVIPYLSIIEQNAGVYAKVFGADALLEHHSGSLMKLKTVAGTGAPGDSEDPRFVPADEATGDDPSSQTSGYRPETENWDAPLIVTTSVRFFESLFSNRPGDLRRVHNVARSIVILDEVQTLPRKLLGPLLGMMKELADDWGVNFVFSTATQPAFQSTNFSHPLLWKPGTLHEIVSGQEDLRKTLKRVEISWEIDIPMSWTQVAERALAAEQSLTIVNLRDHARDLFKKMCEVAQAKGLDETAIFHLSTRMCAAHRLRVIETIRDRIKNRLPCHVTSTQLVEAGVDLDFPLVLRALAPLDSVVQAVGRADREGRLTAELGRPGGRVVVFLPEDNRTPPNDYAEATRQTGVLSGEWRLNGGSIQVGDPKAMHTYFHRYYGREPEDLGMRLVEMREQRMFKTLADEFEMIGNRTKDVYVPHDAAAGLAIEEMRKDLKEKKHFTPEMSEKLRYLQRSIVGLGPWEFDKAERAGVINEAFTGSEIWIATEKAYTDRLGLALELKPGDFVVTRRS